MLFKLKRSLCLMDLMTVDVVLKPILKPSVGHLGTYSAECIIKGCYVELSFVVVAWGEGNSVVNLSHVAGCKG